MSDEPKANFSMILASSVHDMKNSMTSLLDTIEVFFQNSPPQNAEEESQFATMQLQASKVNNHLIKLLGLYRLQENTLPLHIEDIYVHDFLDEQLAGSDMHLSTAKIEIELDCDENAHWYFDRELIWGVINNVLVNSLRHTKDKIAIAYREIDGHCVITVNDNGPGYPQVMIENPEDFTKSIDFANGSTSLGLYFAASVAKLHKRGDYTGYITLENGGDLGGSLFTLHLP